MDEEVGGGGPEAVPTILLPASPKFLNSYDLR